MKKLIIPVLIIALAFSQSCKNNQTSTEENSTDLEEVAPTPVDESQKQAVDSTTVILSKYEPENQRNIRVGKDNAYSRKHKLKGGENYFDTKEKKINVVIPNSVEDMKIIDVFNISDYSNDKSFNAIVINIYHGSPNRTNDTITHKLQAEIEIDKIEGLSIDKLKGSNLKVYIINDGDINDEIKEVFKKCASKETEYSYKECDLRCGELYEQCGESQDCSDWQDGNKDCTKQGKVNMLVPREQEGDIIPPTGG